MERYSSQVAQDRKHNSQVKNLLYGGDAEEAPVRNSGRKGERTSGFSRSHATAVRVFCKPARRLQRYESGSACLAFVDPCEATFAAVRLPARGLVAG